ncbi:MAG: hypothetical protein M3P18_02700, partial [Actinomycetota bacterium]|nr:hypothetical protein [Actinomycetota bacterium]
VIVLVLAALALGAKVDGADTDPTSGSTLSLMIVLLALLLSGFLIWLLTILARRLARRRHGLVLYLRRFGFVEGTAAVTSAAVGSLGRSWRLVTLDDHRTEPISVGTRTRLMGAGLKTAGTIGNALIRVPTAIAYAVFMFSFWGTALVLAHAYYQRRDVNYLFDLYKNGNAHGAEGALVGLGSTSALVSVVVLAVLMLLQAGAQFIAVIPNQYVLAVSRAGELMESAQHSGLTQRSDIGRVVAQISRSSHRGVSARLWVLRVAGYMWRDVVAALAVRSERILIDVSQPSDNVLWEIEHLTPELATRCVFVGRHDRVSWLAEDAADRQTEDVDHRLRDALASRTVLTYADGVSPELFARDLAAALRQPN